MPRTFEAYLHERRTRIADWLSQQGEAVVVTGLCKAWVRDLVDSGCEPFSRHDLSQLPPELNLVARLSDSGLRAYADALAWQIDDREGTEPAEAALIGHAFAVAGGRAYVAVGPGKLHWMGHLVSTVDGQARDAFADSAAISLREDAEQRTAFIEFLMGVVEEANDAPDRVTEIPSRQASMASIVEQFVRTGSFQEVWQADARPVLFYWSDAFEILRRATPEQFVKLIEGLPHPTLVKQCLNSRALAENLGEVLGLLRFAGPSFDTDGRWQRNGLTAILLLQMASTQLLSAANTQNNDVRLAEPLAAHAGSQEAEEIENLPKRVDQFREAANALLDVLFARPDGVELGWHWLENLLRQLPQHRSPAQARGSRKLVIDYIGILARALSSRLAPRRTQEAWIADAKPLLRQYRAIAVLSVAAFSGTAGDLDIGAVAQGLLKRNSFELTGTSDLIRAPGAPLRTIPGFALARIPDVASWFTKAWSGLRFEREQAWRRPPARDGVYANPAEIVGLWGFGTLEALAADETQRGDPRAMWHALEVILREAWLVEPRLAKDFWCQALARLFAWWPRLFVQASGDGAGSTAAEPTGLGDALAPYIGICDDFVGIIVGLHQAGVGVTALDRAVAEHGQDLLRMIRRFFETARGLNDARVWNQDWVSAFRRFETAMATQRLADGRTSP